MNAGELSKYIGDILQNNYIEYEYIVSKDNCLDYITKKILHNIKDINNINSMIKENFKDYIKIEIGSKSNLINIINNIVKINNSNLLETISNFLSDIEYTIEPDNIIEIIKKNKELNNTLKETVSLNKEEITKGKIRDIYSDEVVISLIEAYCEIKNISTIPEADIDNIISEDINRDYLREIKKIKLLTREEEKELVKRIEKGDEQARIKMIKANLRLVVFIARQYRGYNLPFEDLIQEGNIGLIKAIEKYDINKGCKFSTYATWWIRQTIIRAVEEKTRIIKLTPYIDRQIKIYKKAKIHLLNQLGRNPNYKDIASYTGMTEERIKDLERIGYEPVSINTAITDRNNEGADSELSNFIAIEDEELTEKVFIRDMQRRLNKLLDSGILDYKEATILRSIYGIGTNPKTFAETGAILNMSRQRIKQLEKRALYKLSQDEDIKELAESFSKATKTVEDKNQNKKTKKRDQNDELKPSIIKTTIYDYFEEKYNISKNQVDEAIEDLSEKDKEIITIANGPDLENPVRTEEWNHKTKNQYYSLIMPKLLRMIYNKNRINENNESEVIIESGQTGTTIIEPGKEIIEENKEEIVEIEPIKNQIDIVTDEDYLNLLNLLREPIFNQLYKNLTMKEMVVTLLNIGILEDKHFTEEAIGNYFNIKTDEINNIIDKSLTECGDKIEIIERYLKNNYNSKKLIKEKTRGLYYEHK